MRANDKSGGLRRLGIGPKLVILAGLPLLAVALLALAQIRVHSAAAERAHAVDDAVRLAQHLHAVVRTHGVERDRSMGILQGAATGSGQGLGPSREKADRAARALNRLLDRGLPALGTDFLAGDVAPLRQAFQRRARIRELVDERGDAGEVFAFYSQLNAHALRLLRQLAGRIDEARLARGLRAFYGMVGLQEQAAKSRGQLTSVFAVGETSPDQFLAIRGFARAQERFRETFLLNATPAQRQRFERQMEAAPVARAQQVRANFLDPAKDVGAGPGAEAWFGLASERIERIQQVADALADDLHQQARAQVADARWALGANAAFAGAVALAALALVVAFGRSIARPLREAADLTQRITRDEHWDLSARLDDRGQDETARLGRAFNTFLATLAGVVQGLDGKTGELARARGELADGAQAIAARAEENQGEVQRVAASAEEVNGVVQDVARNISEVSESVSDTTRTTQEGKQAADRAADRIRELKESSGRADEILQSIQDVAKKTDLLALNAAIEAANAGEHGKGFAVVADEVRQLAEQTRQATEQVGAIVSEVQGHSDASVQAMNRVMAHMDAVLERVEGIDGSANQIAASAEELAATMSETTDNMQRISGRTDQVAEQVTGIQGTAEEIGELSEELRRMTARFRAGTVEGGGAEPAPARPARAPRLQGTPA